MLNFERITIDSLPTIFQYINGQQYRTCDYTIGGIYMWVDYFNYKYCVYDDTLFIKGYTEDDLQKRAFSLPIGKLSLSESIPLLYDFCERENTPLIFSAIPEDCLKEFQSLFQCRIAQLEDWSDYLYDAQSLATLAGKKYNKKRNHVNKFRRLYENHSLVEINSDNLSRVKDFFETFRGENGKESLLSEYETSMVAEVLNQWPIYNFKGCFLEVDNNIIGFTVGEVVGDTLYTHIEKALRSYDGSYETLNTLFVQYMLDIYKDVKYVNREEDVGDLGLRKAKLSYNPIQILTKYNVAVL